MSTFRTFFSKLKYGRRLKPEQDWFVLLLAALALLGISLVWNLWLFDDVKNGAVLGSASAPLATLTASQRSLGNVQQAFVARAAEEAKYETGAYTFIDPSR
jgi:hypothetical protein